MSQTSRYILAQTAAPLGFAVIVITAIVWLTQSLQRIEIILDNGQSAVTFFQIALLILPSLLAVITPFALLAAALYALNRMHSDSELVVMYAAGMSRWRIAAPLLGLATIGAIVTLILNLWLMPAGYRVMKQMVADIRAEFAVSLVRGGEFTNPVDRVTFFAREASPGGQFRGLLIYDGRERAARVYMADSGLFQNTENGPQLILADGNIQTTDPDTGEVNIVDFDLYQFYMAPYVQTRRELLLELTERYPSELFNPDLSGPWERANEGRLYAEGHARFAAALYNYVFVLIAIVALAGGAYSRRGYPMRIAAASIAALGVRGVGFFAQSAAADAPFLNWTQYAVPLAAASLCLYMLSTLPKPRWAAFRKTASEGAGAS